MLKYLVALALLCGSGSAHELNYDALVRLIQSEHIHSIEALLPQLPEEFRGSYLLMHQSRSLQKATHENPRVILFGRDAKLTCAFTGDGESLECFQFVEASRRFDFREIRFHDGVTFSPSNQTADGKISCTQCHGADPRPNWNHYSIWEGAYGSDDDDLDRDLIPYAAFVARRAEHPRYRWLVQGPRAKDPYMDFKDGVVDMGHRPNLRFSDAVGRLNALRDEHLLAEKVTRAEALAFAIRALQCPLTQELDTRVPKLATVFQKVGISARAWSTQIDPVTDSLPPWEHQAGFGYLSLDVAMAIVEREARAGDAVLAAAVTRMHEYYERRYQGVELVFRRVLNAIVLDPDTFGGHFTENAGSVCPRLQELFANE